jgi:hypothetical protein
MHQHPSEPSGSGMHGGTPPQKVTRAAQQHQLGALVGGRRGSNPLLNGGTGLLAGAALVGLAVLLAFLGQRVVALSMCALSFVTLLLGILALFGGQQSAYVFQRGLVHTTRRRVQVVDWSQVSQLLLWRAGGKSVLADRVLSHYVVTTDGRKLRVEARFDGDRDVFGDQLQATVRHAGKPVVDSGPAAGVARP